MVIAVLDGELELGAEHMRKDDKLPAKGERLTIEAHNATLAVRKDGREWLAWSTHPVDAGRIIRRNKAGMLALIGTFLDCGQLPERHPSPKFGWR